MMNKVVVVLGASRGIGRELVLQFAQDESNTVLAFSRNVEAMKKHFTSHNIHSFYLDLTADDLQDKLTKHLTSFSAIDLLINNAGRLIYKPFLELSKEDIEVSYQTNSVGLILATQTILPKMLENGGHIVNISTMGAVQGSVKFPGLVAYTTSKAGLTAFTELFAEEYKNSKVRMNCLCLGAVQTEMFQEAFPEGKAPLTAQEMANYIKDFAVSGAKYYNGKILSVSSSTP